MTMDPRISEDAFNLLCGKKLGRGVHRDVFECKLRPELVVKVETETDYRWFANVREMQFWNDHSEYKKIADWLAPCRYLSPDGRIMLQARVQPLRKDELPDKLPAFLTDTKEENFGLYEGRVVCCDYASTIPNPSVALRKANWWSEDDHA